MTSPKFMVTAMLLLIIISATCFVGAKTARADLGPKPTVTIVVYENGVRKYDSLKLDMLGCIQSFDQQTMQHYGPCRWEKSEFYWFKGCDNGRCLFTYFLPDKFKIAYRPDFSPVEIVSNEVTRSEINSVYSLNISGGKAILTDSSQVSSLSIGHFILSFIITLFIEFGVFYILKTRWQLPKKLIPALVVGNAITLPIVWLATTQLNVNLLIMELFAVVAEYVIYLRVNKKDNRKLFALAITQNIASFLLGNLLWNWLPIAY